MKFMKLGSKPDQFQKDGDNIRYVATELATDIAVTVGDVKFYLHKFPLLSKSARFQKLVACTDENNNVDINIDDIPGGASAFEICAKFCYGMVVTLNAYNVVAARCAAQFLDMYETVDKGNLIYKIDVFLTSSIFRSWKDSIIVLQTTKSLHPWSEDLKIVSHCVESIASKASIDASVVEWSYTYNRRKPSSEIEKGDDSNWNGVRKQLAVPKDWWVEDLCDLQVDRYKRVVTTIKAKGRVSADVIGEALKAYIFRRLPGFSKGMVPVQGGDLVKYRYLVDTIIWLVPREKNSVSCSFLLKLLHASITLECGETGRKELMKKIGKQLEEASVSDFLLQASSGETTMYNIDIIHDLVEQFVIQEQHEDGEFEELCSGVISDASKAKVARLVHGYLAEAARDPTLVVSKFMDLAEMVSGFPRPSHDGIYRAIDLFLKEHPEITKSERKKLCKLMDCRKLSVEACSHAVRNERLPMRVVVQVLFFEQIRAMTSSGGETAPDLSGSIKALRIGSHGSSRSASTNTEEDWDAVPTAEDLKTLTGEFATLRMKEAAAEGGKKNNLAKLNATGKGKGLIPRKVLSKLWSNKERHSENSSSDTSDSPASSTAEETKSTPSRSRRHYSSWHHNTNL